ncbi:MAG: OmpA family protein [Candidatus Kapabacteria bacterium]|nr:OmpA family protein [Candidatus Kapabacteria bacterium]
MKKLLLLLMLVTSSNLFAQYTGLDTLRPRYGGNFGIGLNLHNADFKALPDVPCCSPGFTSASKFGMTLGANYQTPLSNEIFLGAKLNYLSQSVQFLTDENIILSVNNTEFKAVSEHQLQVDLASISIEPNVTYRLTKDLYLNFGFSIFNFISKSYTQQEELISPTDKGTYENNLRVRGKNTGNISKMSSMAFGVSFGASYELALNTNKTLFALPEIYYNYGLNNINSDLNWKVSEFRAGISIAFSPYESIKKNISNIKIDTINIETDKIKKNIFTSGKANVKEYVENSADTIKYVYNYTRQDTLFISTYVEPIVKEVVKEIPEEELPNNSYLFADLEVLGKNDNEALFPLTNINLRVELSRDIYPILPYIFYEFNSSVIPERYKKLEKDSKFDPSELDPSPISYHRNNLNILGKRLQENPKSEIILHGTTDPSTEKDNCELAKSRSKSIKDYLVNIFGIDQKRITVEENKTCIPKDITRTQSEIGYAENRRVEIETNQPELLFAVSNTRYQNPTVISPNSIILRPKAQVITSKEKGDFGFNKMPKKYDKEELRNWVLSVEQNDFNLLMQDGGSTLQDLPILITRNNAKKLENGVPIKIDFTAYDGFDNIKNINKSLIVKKDTSDIESQGLTLTVFQVSQYTLDNRIKKEIRSFVKNLDKESTIIIRGYSDLLGNAEDNKRLSAVRANEVRDYIKSINSSANITEAIGLGSEKFAPGINSYNTPEERFMSRTVEIQIRKKLEK